MLEGNPVSFILRPILLDPATNKILTFAFSLVLVISSSNNVRKIWNKVPLLVIFGSSLLYSAFSLLIVVLKKQESITKCGILKKIFRGRAIFWHEIQTTAAVTFAVANISGIVINQATYEATIQVIFSSLNIVFFTLEWYFAAEKSKFFVTEENPKLGHNCLDCMLGGIHAFPLFFNILRKGCLIAALVLVATNSNFGNNISYYIYFIAFAIAGSFALFVLQTSGSLENAVSTKLISGRKWHTYLMLIVVIHCFLAVLTFSLIVETKEYVYARQNSTEVYDFYIRDKNRGSYDRRSVTLWLQKNFRAPVESPTALVLSCIALLLAVLDLYSRAIYSRSCRDNEITAPLNVPGGISKVEDLPINIALPQSFDNAIKQHVFHY